MNNKGFAVTGFLYSILVLFIVIATLLIFNLQNKKVILDKLKSDALDNLENNINEGEEICSYEVGQEFTFDYTGSEQTFTVPCSGYYKLETWGAQGGSTTVTGGYGAYSFGEIYLKKSTNLYINVGGKGTSYTYNGGNSVNYGYSEGGYNGGGAVTPCYSGTGGAGGGATHIATISGLLYTLDSYKDTDSTYSSKGYYTSNEILIVSSGGGGAGNTNVGGSGGGVIGNSGTGDDGYATGGTQISGGIDRYNAHSGFGYGSDFPTLDPGAFCGQGGGGGFFGGGRGFYGDNTSAGGGSGYIGNNSLFNKHMTCYECETAYQTNIKTVSNTNVSATATADYSKSGNGYAKITYLGKKKNANKTKYTITNMISNGSFEDDFDNFTYKADNASISSTESAYGNKSYKRGTSTKAGGTTQYINLVEGHVYYYFLYAKTNGLVIHSDVSYTGWGIQANSSSWKKFSSIQKSTTTDKKNISLNYGNDITEDTYVDGVGFVDLTEAFGAGNEPSKEWCDIHIDYFDGTKTIYK